MSTPLSELLNTYLKNRGWSYQVLAELTGVQESTVHNWIRGTSRTIQKWKDAVKAAGAFGLDRAQADAFFAASGKRSYTAVFQRVKTEEDRALFVGWGELSPAPASNLPYPLTSFVGREEELAQIRQLLASPDVRIVTLMGPGGSGKTRLALAIAHALEDAYDSVCFVDLAPVRDPGHVLLTIADALAVPRAVDTSAMTTLIDHLRGKRVLLVLDNFEHVVTATLDVGSLLTSTESVKGLVTSRMRLLLQGEQVVDVDPLPLPGNHREFEGLVRNPAVVLFAERARAAKSAFTLTPKNAPHVADVCERLDGLPLAIELAAPRTRQMRVSDMLTRLPKRLEMVDEGPRDAPARQRTLRDTIAWTYDLLSSGEQRLFTVIGVFANGFTREATAAVCAACGSGTIDVAKGLESLADQNMLRRNLEAEHEFRYGMFETIREYAQERLQATEEDQVAQRAHARYYLELAERADLLGGGQKDWLHRLSAEHANLGGALAWCDGHLEIEMGLRLCVALMPYWQLRDHRFEARDWWETFMAVAHHVPARLRALGLMWQGILLMRVTGEVSIPSLLFNESLAQFHEDRDSKGASEALQSIGDALRQAREWKQASVQYDLSLGFAKQSGDDYLAAHACMGLALCAQEEGDYDAAIQHWTSMRDLASRANNAASLTMALNSLGEMARHRTDWGEAERFYGETLTHARSLGSKFWEALALHNLGYVAFFTGDPDGAKGLFLDSLRLYGEIEYEKGEAECLSGLGKLEASEGELEWAALLCGASETMLERLHAQLDTMDRTDYEQTLALLHVRLGDQLESLLAEGRAMSHARAVALALNGPKPTGTI